MAFFNAKDADGNTIKVYAEYDSINGIYIPVSTLPSRPMISRFADTNGDGTGTFEAIGNYSGGATDFWIEPPAGEYWHIFRLIVELRDTGSFRAEYYGAGAALTNGIKIIHEVSAVENDLTAQSSIKNNAQWASYCYDINNINFGAGDDFMVARWTFANAGTALELFGDTDDKIIVRLNDDFTGLNAHRFLIQGFKITGT